MHATVTPVRYMVCALLDIQTRNISVIVTLDIPENTAKKVKTVMFFTLMLQLILKYFHFCFQTLF